MARSPGPAAAGTRTLFHTLVHEASLLGERGGPELLEELKAACLSLAEEDAAGRAWCRANGYGGYTSYASLDDLPRRMSVFDDLRRRLDRRVAAFAEELAFDLRGRRLKLDSLWVNVLRPGAAHGGHIHPHSAVSGTFYVDTPPGAAGIRFEDPRLAAMMAAPVRRAQAPENLRPFVTLTPKAGDLLLWESWLRHEVPPGAGRSPRISISFNYG